MQVSRDRNSMSSKDVNMFMLCLFLQIIYMLRAIGNEDSDMYLVYSVYDVDVVCLKFIIGDHRTSA